MRMLVQLQEVQFGFGNRSTELCAQELMRASVALSCHCFRTLCRVATPPRKKYRRFFLKNIGDFAEKYRRFYENIGDFAEKYRRFNENIGEFCEKCEIS